MVDGLAKQVEREKMKAIGARNHLKSIAKERDSQKQQLQALIAEKKMQLERYMYLSIIVMCILMPTCCAHVYTHVQILMNVMCVVNNNINTVVSSYEP